MKRKIMSLKEYLTKNFDKEIVEAFYKKNEKELQTEVVINEKGEEIREV